ncbi:MAG TPA: hypothetical protein VJB97_03275 [Candidatus Paceibacterota bacterium]
MPGASPLVFLIADTAFFLALAACIVFGVVFGYYSLRAGESRTVALVSLSVYVFGCILILLFALSTTNIGL